MIEAGDIIGVASNEWLSKSIRSATGNGPISHVGIVTATSPMIQVTQALSRVVVSPLDVMLKGKTAAFVISPHFLSDAQRFSGVRRALDKVGRDYSYWNILLQLVDSWSHTKFFAEHFAEQFKEICSQLVDASEPIDELDSKTVTPNDIYRTAAAHIDRWSITPLI